MSAASSQTRRMKAEVDKNEHVGAPMKGEVVVVKVKPGDVVEAGQVRIVGIKESTPVTRMGFNIIN